MVQTFKTVSERKQNFTCNGVLSDDIRVKPTISEKYIVTHSNDSAVTCLPAINSVVTDLYIIKEKREQKKIMNIFCTLPYFVYDE